MTDSVHIGSLPIDTRIKWTDGAGREHHGIIKDWPDRPTHAEGVRVVESLSSEIDHFLPKLRQVEVVGEDD